jgi:hypothetical protein
MKLVSLGWFVGLILLVASAGPAAAAPQPPLSWSRSTASAPFISTAT